MRIIGLGGSAWPFCPASALGAQSSQLCLGGASPSVPAPPHSGFICLDLAHGHRPRTFSRLEHLQEAQAPRSHVLNQRKSLLSPGHRDSASVTPAGQANPLVTASHVLLLEARQVILQFCCHPFSSWPHSCPLLSCHSAPRARAVCVVLPWWQAQLCAECLPCTVCGSESLPGGP